MRISSEPFTDEEWETVREAPELAGLLVLTADEGGSIREAFGLAKAFADARADQDDGGLVDRIASAGPPGTRRYESDEELREHGLETLRRASELVAQKAPGERESYRAFVLAVAERVAQAHTEEGQPISPREQDAIAAVAQTV